MWFIELCLRTCFILKHNRFLTTAIFTGSASTVLKFHFLLLSSLWCMLIIALYSVSRIRSYFFCSKTPKWIIALNFSGLSKLVRMGKNAWQGSSVYRIPSCATETSQLCCKGIKARHDVFWVLSITFKYFVCLKKKVNSNVLSFNLKLFQAKVDIKSVIRDLLI